MEFLNSLYQRVLESTVWKSVFSHLQWIDWLAAAAVFAGFFSGLKKGFTKAFLESVTWVSTAVLTLEFYPQAVTFLKQHLGFLPEAMMIFAAFTTLALSCLLVFRILFWGPVFFLPAADESLIELLLAVVFNIFNNLLFLSLAANAILLSPWGRLKPVFGNGDSYAGYALVQLAVRIHAALPGPLAALRGVLHL